MGDKSPILAGDAEREQSTPAFVPPPGAPRLRIRVAGPGGTLYVRSSLGWREWIKSW
jgi:hypothetical protein